ncbi:hypothetical protein [Mycobacterium sp. ITM-2016-00318]|uniref:hypothetical protein n=1 Tax=Mycobacterium sp. ITM-2016-00318 TaxID=2099693 RepID=UPI001E50F60D|nr:hypothetical protein [Mycobacterium sp. ITM-2016-00318]WNG94344.1 hypothetical protein C6A82_007885 [Mycobacterium sp. ITM-2016-00318]
MAVATNECAAAASNNFGEEVGASAATRGAAESAALGKLQNQTRAKVIVSGCSNGNTPPPPNEPPPRRLRRSRGRPFRSTRSSAVSSLTSPTAAVTSQCTYATDDYNRSFGLPANSTYDLRIVPAVPRFKNWTVTVNCDNGTSTTATTYF